MKDIKSIDYKGYFWQVPFLFCCFSENKGFYFVIAVMYSFE